MATAESCYLNEFKEILEESQRGKHNHLLKRVKKIFEECRQNDDDVFPTITHLLRYFLVVGPKEPTVDRVFQFISQVVRYKNEDPLDLTEKEGLAISLITHLIALHNVANSNVRFRSCQLLSILLSDMEDDVAIDDNLHEKMCEALLVCLKDKTAVVRQFAVHALARLQDPQNPKCPIIKEYLFHLERDPNPEVRIAVLQSVGASKQILPRILDRTRDAKESVRKAAFIFLAERVHFRCLTIAQRVQLLKDGLRDRGDIVQKTVRSKLIPAWIKLTNNDELQLLSFLDIENFTEAGEILMTNFLKDKRIETIVDRFQEIKNQENLFANSTYDNLTCEIAFYIRTTAQFLKSENRDEELERILPELILFCDYVENVIKIFPKNLNIENRMSREFIIKELILVLGTYEIVDEPSRQAVTKLIQKVLTSSTSSFGDGVIGPLINLSASAFDEDETKLTTFIIEIISDIRQPITCSQEPMAALPNRDMELAKARVELNELREKLQIAASKQLFLEAAELQVRVEALTTTIKELSHVPDVEMADRTIIDKTDTQTWTKALVIASELLKQPVVQTMTSSLRSLVEDLLLPGVQNSDPVIRNLAVKSLGLACLLDKEMAQEKALLFLQILQIDQETIRLTSTKCLFDFLIAFGVDAFDPDDNNSDLPGENERSSIISVLSLLLDNEESDIRSVIVEGLGKLLLFDRITSSKLLSRLILLWYNPITDDDSILRHLLGVFLPLYASSSRLHQQHIEQAFLPTLNTIFDAPKSSPLSNVDPMNVAKFMVALTHPKMAPPENKSRDSENVHLALAIRICTALLNEIRFYYIRVYTKTLTLLDFNGCDDVSLRQLVNLHNQLKKLKMEKSCAKLLSKFRDKLTEVGFQEEVDDVNTTAARGEEIENESRMAESRRLRSKQNSAFLNLSIVN